MRAAELTTEQKTNGLATNGTGSGTATGTATGSGTGSGTGGTTALTVSPNPIDFGYVSQNSISIGCTTVSNDSNAPITITGVGSFENAGGSFQVAATNDAHPPVPFSFPITIGGGDSAQVCFSFTCPITQDYSGQVTLVINDPGVSNPVVQLSGWCGGPQISCAPLTLAFGRVTFGQTSTLPVTCTNIGTALPGLGLTIGPLEAGGPAFSVAFDAITNPYPSGGLAPGQSAQIDVTYTPSVQPNDYGVLVIPNNGGDGQTPYVSLSGGPRSLYRYRRCLCRVVRVLLIGVPPERCGSERVPLSWAAGAT